MGISLFAAIMRTNNTTNTMPLTKNSGIKIGVNNTTNTTPLTKNSGIKIGSGQEQRRNGHDFLGSGQEQRGNDSASPLLCENNGGAIEASTQRDAAMRVLRREDYLTAVTAWMSWIWCSLTVHVP